jgi:hypothetical protein
MIPTATCAAISTSTIMPPLQVKGKRKPLQTYLVKE